MPKQFYTEHDIEDLVKRGVMSLELNDNVVLTDLAYEKANRLGMRLVRQSPDNPPGAPVRPYLSQAQPAAPRPAARPAAPAPSAAPSGGSTAARTDEKADLHQRIRSAVQARLGGQVDSHLLDVIIQRVLNSTGVK